MRNVVIFHLYFLHIFAFYYAGIMVYILDGGGEGVPISPLCALVTPYCSLSGIFCLYG